MLREDRAFAIALQVFVPLGDRVRLTCGDTRRSVVRSYQWIDIDLPEPDKQREQPGLAATLRWVHKAREACVVLHLLACCVGFRGHENDVFWKRVFERVSSKERATKENAGEDDGFGDFRFGGTDDEDDSDLRQRSVSDGLRFFDDPANENDSTFPRFRLKVPFSVEFGEPLDAELTERYWNTQGDDELSALARLAHAARARCHAEGSDEEDDDEDVGMEVDDGGRHMDDDDGLVVEDHEEEKNDSGRYGDVAATSEWFDTVVRTFTALEKTPKSPSLVAIVNELMPYIDSKRYYGKPVEIGVSVTEFYVLKNMASKIHGLISNFARDAHRIDKATCSDRLKNGVLRFPHVQLSEFAMEFMEPLENHKELQWLTEIIETCDVIIPYVQVQPSTMIDDEAFSRFIPR